MPTTNKRKLLVAVLRAMAPLARLMLRNGVGYKEFSSICKQAFVEVATSDYGIRGRPTNISRVAVMTGLTRKEVKKIREAVGENIEALSSRLSPQAEILHYWHSDPMYLEDNGLPRELEFDGGGITFSKLSRAYAGDIPPGAMRTELKRVGAITETKDGRLRVNRRDFVPAGHDERLIEGLSSSVSNLISTVAFNSDEANTYETRFEKCVYNARIGKHNLDAVREELHKRLMAIAIDLDDYMAAFEVNAGDSAETCDSEIGVGIFYFEKEK